MFDNLRRAFKEAVENFKEELDRDAVPETVDRLLRQMTNEATDAKAYVSRLEVEIEKALKAAEAEKREASTCRRREKMALEIGDEETASLASSYAEMQAARLLTLQAAWHMDKYGASNSRIEIAIIKFYGAQVLYNVIDRAIQAHGALGVSTDMPLELMYRAARAARIYDGPDEVHKVTVARKLLKNYSPTEVPSEHRSVREDLARAKFADMLDQFV